MTPTSSKLYIVHNKKKSSSKVSTIDIKSEFDFPSQCLNYHISVHCPGSPRISSDDLMAQVSRPDFMGLGLVSQMSRSRSRGSKVSVSLETTLSRPRDLQKYEIGRSAVDSNIPSEKMLFDKKNSGSRSQKGWFRSRMVRSRSHSRMMRSRSRILRPRWETPSLV